MVETAGSMATAPAHTLYDIVRKLPDGADVELSAWMPPATPVGCSLTGRTLALRTAACLPNEDFPTIER